MNLNGRKVYSGRGGIHILCYIILLWVQCFVYIFNAHCYGILRIEVDNVKAMFYIII